MVAAAHAEFPFTLPIGFRDGEGTVHREGAMRMATAYDEIAPLKDPRVQQNPGYVAVILLSRVVTKLGSLEHMNPKVIEGLMAADFSYLQDLYRRVNETGHSRLAVACPHCQGEFEVETSPVGES
jgi:hypothetical protein